MILTVLEKLKLVSIRSCYVIDSSRLVLPLELLVNGRGSLELMDVEFKYSWKPWKKKKSQLKSKEGRPVTSLDEK